MKIDGWKLYCEAFRSLFPSASLQPDGDIVSPAALQEMAERLLASRPEVAMPDDAALWELRKAVLAYTAWSANPHSGARATELSAAIGSAKKLLEERGRLHLHPTAADSLVRSPLAGSSEPKA